ncbi:MAG: hypothetical protein K940chlam8_00441, partial [Chlamydiae bacterium]|nr:hypothetical protein [Chlamydiota bacterium]
TDADYERKGEMASPSEKEAKKVTSDAKGPTLWDEWEKQIDSAYPRVQSFIDDGFFDTEVIPHEMLAELGVSERILPQIASREILLHVLAQELTIYVKDKHMSLNYRTVLMEILEVFVDKYIAVNGEDFKKAYTAARDLMRMGVYQQIHERKAITGSHHGILHMAKNIEASLRMLEDLKSHNPDNVTDRDYMLTIAMHILHDVGYTTGISESSFKATKDHPLIGANMLEKYKDYFVHYYGEDGYKVLFQTILYHAIARSEIRIEAPDRDIHYGVIRAVTAVGDGIQVAAQDKLQEVWLSSPEIFDGLTELAYFCAMFPEYNKIGFKLSHPEINTNSWGNPPKGLDRSNPLDRIAYDIFQHSRAKIYSAIRASTALTKQQRNDYMSTLDKQYNAMTASIIFAQLGLVIERVEAVPKPGEAAGTCFIPQIHLRPSLVQGVIERLIDLGAAEKNVRKVIEEFGGNPTELLEKVKMQRASPNPQVVKDDRDFAQFRMSPNYDVAVDAGTLTPSQKVYHRVHEHLEKAERNAVAEADRGACRTAFQDILGAFSDCMRGTGGWITVMEGIEKLQSYKSSLKNLTPRLEKLETRVQSYLGQLPLLDSLNLRTDQQDQLFARLTQEFLANPQPLNKGEIETVLRGIGLGAREIGAFTTNPRNIVALNQLMGNREAIFTEMLVLQDFFDLSRA